jgi:N-acetylmuramoyl-L-alanine amidase
VTGYRPTRRELVGAAAAASLLRPAVGIAAQRATAPTVFSRELGLVEGTAPPLAAPRPFLLAGVQWSGPAGARIELRAQAGGSGAWSRWALASTLGHGPDVRRRPESLYGEPVWFGDAVRFQVRASDPVWGVRVHFVSGSAGLTARAATTYPLAQPVLDAGPGQPPIIARAAWAGARRSPVLAPVGYGTVQLAFVHHTDNPNGYTAGAVPAMLLAMYDYHRFVRGWADIGYNFVIDAFGRIWEARAGGIDEAVIGAQAGGYNQAATGVSVLGTFTSVVPSAAAIAALEHLLAWKLSLHGTPARGQVTVRVNPGDAFYTPFAPGAHVSLPRVAGHRQGDTTDCPGDAFYARLPDIRRRVTALAGAPARITIAAPAATVAGVPVVVSGKLRLLDRTPLAATQVEIQALGPRGVSTVASATTAAGGSWTASLGLTDNARLRALHPSAPAAVSELIDVGVAPTVTLIVDSLSPLRVSGTVSPTKRHVTVSLYALHGSHRRLVGSPRRVTVLDGRFALRIARPRAGPGRYVVVVRTAADARNLAGASAPLAFAL